MPLFVLIGLAVYVLIEVPSPRTRARQAWEREQRELTRQQLQATQALVEEVRRLRETLEVRR